MEIKIEACDLQRYNRLRAELALKQAEFSLFIADVEDKYGVTAQRDQINFERGTVTKEADDANHS